MSVNTHLKLTDGMSPALKRINEMMQKVEKTMQRVEQAMANDFGDQAFNQATTNAGELATTIEDLGSSTEPLVDAMSEVKDRIDKVDEAMGGLADSTEPLKRGVKNVGNEVDHKRQKLEKSETVARRLSKIFQAMTIAGLIAMGRKFLQGNIATADKFNTLTAQINLINDGLQTSSELQDKIMASAQRVNAEYTQMASTVFKLYQTVGELFGSNAAVIQFAETIKQASSISGSGAHGIEMAFKAIDRAMAEGAMSARDFDIMKRYSVRSAQAIADYMGVSVAETRNLAVQGKITSDVLANTMLNSVDVINDEFQSIPKTWQDMMVSIRNQSLQAFQPLMESSSRFINSDGFKVFKNAWVNGIRAIAQGLSILFSVFRVLADFIARHSRVFKTILGTIGFMIGVTLVRKMYAFASAAIKNFFVAGAAGQSAGYKVMLAWLKANWQFVALGAIIAGLIIFWDDMGQVAKAALMGIAVALLIVKLAALGVTWPFLLIVAIVAIVVLGFLFFRDIAVEVFGAIVGAAFWMGQLLVNVGKGIANLFIAVWEWIVNAFHTVVYGIQLGWYHVQRGAMTMASAVVKGVQGMVDAILGAISSMINGAIRGLNRLIDLANNIPGVNISTMGEVELSTSGNWGSGIQDAMDGLERPTRQTAEFGRFEYGSLGDAFSRGQEVGRNAGNAVGNALDVLVGRAQGLLSGNSNGENQGLNSDYLNRINNGVGGVNDAMGPGLGSGSNIGDIGRIREDVKITDEDLKLFRDIARRDTVVNHSTLSPNVSVTYNATGGNAPSAEDIAGAVEDLIISASATNLSRA